MGGAAFQVNITREQQYTRRLIRLIPVLRLSCLPRLSPIIPPHAGGLLAIHRPVCLLLISAAFFA
jgi:hypothetical protein